MADEEEPDTVWVIGGYDCDSPFHGLDINLTRVDLAESTADPFDSFGAANGGAEGMACHYVNTVLLGRGILCAGGYVFDLAGATDVVYFYDLDERVRGETNFRDGVIVF